jgi:hypothetical protein
MQGRWAETLDRVDILMTLAELSLALGGFTAVVVALRARSDGGIDIPRPVMASLLLVILGAAIIPVVCITVLNFVTADLVVWRIGSLLMVSVAVAWFMGLVPLMIAERRASGEPITITFIFILGASAINGVGQAFNALASFPHHAFAVMFAGLAWYFISGAIVFARLLVADDAA